MVEKKGRAVMMVMVDIDADMDGDFNAWYDHFYNTHIYMLCNMPNNATLNVCPSGKYIINVNNEYTICQDCPFGYISKRNASKCFECPKTFSINLCLGVDFRSLYFDKNVSKKTK